MKAKRNIKYNVVMQVERGTSQELAVHTKADETLLCGTRGSMKTISQLLAFVKYVGRGYGHFWRGVIFDQEYRFLDDIIKKSWQIFKPLGAEYNKSEKMWTFRTGETLVFRKMKVDDDYWDFHGHEYTFIGFNELTKYATAYLYDMIGSCLRSGFVPEQNCIIDAKTGARTVLPPIPLMMLSTTNPNGVGHNWVKRRFIDVAPYGHIVARSDKVYDTIKGDFVDVKRTQVAIFSSFLENPYLDNKTKMFYLNYPDPNIRKAWAEGSWDITTGGMFGDLWDRNIHVIPRFTIPKSWYVDRTFDWGSSHPFSVGWWARANGEEVDMLLDNGEWVKFCPPKGSLIQIYEYYGADELGTNRGWQMGAREIAKNIVDIEQRLQLANWVEGEIHAGAADNQIWNKINTDNPCIADIMESENVSWERSDKSAGSRINGCQLMRDLLISTKNKDGDYPHIYFMNNCVASIGTIPILPRDDKNIDDVDTNAEDHPWDMTRYRILQSLGTGDIIKVRYR